MASDINSLLLGFTVNPAVKELLCAYVTRTGLVCKGIRSHAPGEVAFNVETWPEQPGQPRRPAVYTMHFDPSSGEPTAARLELLG